MRTAVVWALALVLGCGAGSDSGAPAARPTSTTTTTGPRPSTTQPSPPTTIAPLDTPEDARRFLEERGIDPERLSEEVGEHMRQRFRSGDSAN